VVVKVKLEGLNITRDRTGRKFYVYRRDTGATLLKGFEGSREDLAKRLSMPDMVALYNAPRVRRLDRVFPEGTLGALVAWYKSECPDYAKLSAATKKDYDAAYDWLAPEFDFSLSSITTPELYGLRDKCATAKWPRFADKMIAALSSMFSRAVKRGKMLSNPCLGMDKAHQSDPNSNREWFGPEWLFVRDNAPMEVLIPCMIARYAGLAGQTIVGLNEKQIVDDPEGPTGKAVSYTRRKNGKTTRLPVDDQLQAFLTARKVRSSDGLIAIRDDGSVWASEKEMQTRVSHWLRDRERDGLIGAGTTLHGLRVSYAAWWKRMGASDHEVAGLIGDRSLRMGTHYTRHVEAEQGIIRAFRRLDGKS